MAASVWDLAKQSGFIFEGTVRRIGAVASPGVAATPSTVVVQVNKVIKGPAVLSRFAGKEITVIPGEHEGAAPKKHAVFFTNAFHYGEGLAVRAVGYHEPTGPDVEHEVHEAMKQSDEDELLKHLRDARLVVSGSVMKITPHEDRERVGSEHDPDWKQFIIEVDSVEKGSPKREKSKTGKIEIAAFFANSTDVAWYQSPKPREGDKGVFILHEGEVRSRQTPGPAIVHPLDFRPISEVEHVRALIQRIAQ